MKTTFLVIIMIILAISLVYVLINPSEQGISPTRTRTPTVPIEDQELERSAPEIITEPIAEPIGTTTTVTTITDVETAFNNYVQSNNLNWDFLESEIYEQNSNGDVYKVTYRHYELSGGKRRVLIDSQGNVYQLYGLS